MVDHYLQKHIITDLVECETARYADLKPAHIEGNVFSYHLQSLIKQKLIQKNENGSYNLTSSGKLYGINNSLRNHDLLSQAHAIVLLSIRENNRWLLRTRLVQPMYGKVGFIHGEPIAGESVESAGQKVLLRRTGLSGDMTVRGSGYVCIKQADELISFTSFTLLEVNNLKGDLIPTDNHGSNVWYEAPDFDAPEMIPSMPVLVAKLEQPELFFVDIICSLER